MLFLSGGKFKVYLTELYILWNINKIVLQPAVKIKKSINLQHQSSGWWRKDDAFLQSTCTEVFPELGHMRCLRDPCWTDFPLALLCDQISPGPCSGGRREQTLCPGCGDSLRLWHRLSFIDIIHVQIILGPIVHLLRSQICAQLVLNIKAGLQKMVRLSIFSHRVKCTVCSLWEPVQNNFIFV